MLSNKPYLVRAFYQWIVDSGCTPFLLLDAKQSRCKVPREFIEDGQVTFNISPNAIRDLDVRQDSIQFRASFSGVVHIIFAPMTAVLAVFAEENQQGMFFDPEEEVPEPVRPLGTDWNSSAKKTITSSTTTNKKTISHLSLVE